MRIGLQTWGSDGDILPFMALAGALTKAGHTVTVAYTSVDGKDYQALATASGFAAIRAFEAMPTGKDLYQLSSSSNPLFELMALLGTCYEPATEAMYAASEHLCTTNDLVVCHTLCHTLVTAAQKHNCPRIALALSPMVVRTAHASPIGPSLGRWTNSMLWSVGDRLLTLLFFSQAKKIRAREGLPAIRSLQDELFTSPLLTLMACSAVLCPRPSDWNPHLHISGFLNIPEEDDRTLPPETQHFLASGPPPLYMTFGTCTQFALEANMQLFAEAAMQAGQRAIIQTTNGWTPPADHPSQLHFVGRMHHSNVFPHCSAIVHHGGAGTTQAALLAGRPSIVVAHAYDQPDWAKRLYHIGAAARPLHRRSITAKVLAKAIGSTVSSSTLQHNATVAGEKMRQENGLNNVVMLIETIIGH